MKQGIRMKYDLLVKDLQHMSNKLGSMHALTHTNKDIHRKMDTK